MFHTIRRERKRKPPLFGISQMGEVARRSRVGGGMPPKKEHVIASQSADWRGNPPDLERPAIGRHRKIEGIATSLRSSQ